MSSGKPYDFTWKIPRPRDPGFKPRGYKLFSKALDFEPTLTLNNINPFDINGEVKALGHTLTVLKNNAENIYGAHKHANNKKEHADPKQDSYDPIVSYNLSKKVSKSCKKIL